MAEITRLQKLQIVDDWLTEQIDAYSRTIRYLGWRHVELQHRLTAERDVLDHRREQVRFEIDALQTRITEEAVEKQEVGS